MVVQHMATQNSFCCQHELITWNNISGLQMIECGKQLLLGCEFQNVVMWFPTN